MAVLVPCCLLLDKKEDRTVLVIPHNYELIQASKGNILVFIR